MTEPDDGALLQVHVDAVQYYRVQLAGDTAATARARAFLHARSVPATAVAAYELGYAPAGWTSMTEHLRAHGHQDETLLAAGVSVRSRRGDLLDRFRDRLMFPVHHPSGGQVVGLLGRLLPAAATPAAIREPPKYLNSPQTSAYHKGEVLYGLTGPARQALAAGAVPVLVEGPLDAIAVTNCHVTSHTGRPPRDLGGLSAAGYVGVAPCGTALTVPQVGVLQACAGPLSERQVVTAFDNDSAGQQAGLRAFELLRTAGAWPHAAELPRGLDPADLASRSGPAALAAALRAGSPLADRVVDARLEPWAEQLRWAEGRVGATRDAARLIATFPPEQVSRQVQRVALRLGLAHGELTAALLEAISPDDPPEPPQGQTSTGGRATPAAARSRTQQRSLQAAQVAGASYPTDITPQDSRQASLRGAPPAARSALSALSSTAPRHLASRATAAADLVPRH